jgi:hypothetical protein
MGYFGPGAFDNDKGLDWLGDARGKTLPQDVGAALEALLAYRKKLLPALSPKQIREEIEFLMSVLKDSALPPHQKRRHGTKAAWLAAARAEQEEYYGSGAYRREQQAPVEAGLAAAELVSCWRGHPPADLPANVSRRIAALVKGCGAAKPSPALVTKARRAVAAALAAKDYRKLRAFHLAASPGLSGGDDDLAAVRDLAGRLQRASR